VTSQTDDILVILLAGGQGTRIRHLAPHLPKPMIPVGGRPFLQWSIRYFAAQGLGRFLISAGHKAEVIGEHFSQNPLPGVAVRTVAEPSPMGTGGGLRYAVRAVQPSQRIWIVANADSLVLADLASCVEAFRGGPAQAGIVGVRMDDASRYGTLVSDGQGRLVAFCEKRPGSGTINAGVYLFKAELLDRFADRQPLSLETDVFPDLLRQGVEIRVWPQEAKFVDMGTESGLVEAERFVRQHQEWFA
jgi:D-glycero-alpha-D-manno-heptose 1-phosphate guanylyltransferase